MELDTRDLDHMTIPELKDELRKYGETVGGTRPELQARLEPLVAVDRMYARSLVNTDSDTFWRIAVIGNATVVHHGKQGHAGSKTEREFEANAEAIKYAKKQTTDKLKTYAEEPKKRKAPGATPAAAAAAAAAPTAPASIAKRARAAAAAAAPAVATAFTFGGGAAAAAGGGALGVGIGGAAAAKPGIPDASAPLGIVDAASGLAGSGRVLNRGGVVFDCMLNQLNLSTNTDKYYIAQVIEDKGKFYCFTHWGRTGLAGQNKLEGPYDAPEEAIELFEAKFKEKTNNDWSNRAHFKHESGRYDLLKTDYAALASKSKAKWQYYMHAAQDGKAVGWYDYDAAASDIVEGVHDNFLSNKQLGVRIVQSGHWSYRVDLTLMQQTNISTQMQRPIRRVALDGEDGAAAAKKAGEAEK